MAAHLISRHSPLWLLEEHTGPSLCPLGVCLAYHFPESCDSSCFIHIPGAVLAGGQRTELGRTNQEGLWGRGGEGEEMDGSGQVPSLQGWPGWLSLATAALPAALLSPSAQPQLEAGQVTSTLTFLGFLSAFLGEHL